MKLDIQELLKSINNDVALMTNLGQIDESNLKQLLVHLCDIYDKSAVIKVLKSEDAKTIVSEYVMVEEIEKAPIKEPIVEKPIENIAPKTCEPDKKIAETWEHKLSLHEKIAKEKEDLSLAVKLQKKPIDNLAKAIGLNEKILFIKELFGGNAEEFKKHVDTLNEKSNFEDAKFYLDSIIIPTYKWKGSDPAATHFITLLQRRFIE